MHKFIVWRIGATCLLAASLLSPVASPTWAQSYWCDDHQPHLRFDNSLVEISKHFIDVEFRIDACAREIAELRHELHKVKEQLGTLMNVDLYTMLLDLERRIAALEDRDRSK